ncbi:MULTISPECIES: hypothetical protein [unclassified Streptomyces]|uniref:hypothetical protein n=1 Tax=unclassified Streptomyces TaxID=2593676 RepID=UPI002E2AA0B2|nr:hypothetical protein [Streptomyces sp. NBC_00228]
MPGKGPVQQVLSTAGRGKAAWECFGQEARLHISRLISTSCATVRERVLADAA